MKIYRQISLVIILALLFPASACQPDPAIEPATPAAPPNLPATVIPAPSPTPSPAPTPTGFTGKLAGDGQDGNVYLFDLEKASASLLFEGFSMRAVSPDGLSALLEKRVNPRELYRPPDLDLYLGNLATGQTTLLAANYCCDAMWLPGGEGIAFVGPAPGREASVVGEKVNYRAFTVRPDGSGMKAITPPDTGVEAIFPLPDGGLFWTVGTHEFMTQMETIWTTNDDGTTSSSEQEVAYIASDIDPRVLKWSSLDGSTTRDANIHTAFGKSPAKENISIGLGGTFGLTLLDGKFMRYVSTYNIYFDQPLEDYVCEKGACALTVWTDEYPEGLKFAFQMPEETMETGKWEPFRAPLLLLSGKVLLLPQAIIHGEEETRGVIYAVSQDGKVVKVITPPVEPSVGGEFTTTKCEPAVRNPFPYSCPVVSGKISPDGNSFLVLYESEEGPWDNPLVNRWYIIDLESYDLKEISSLFSVPMGQTLYWTNLP